MKNDGCAGLNGEIACGCCCCCCCELYSIAPSRNRRFVARQLFEDDVLPVPVVSCSCR